ncbi:MAG TPA: hypothetical protein VHA35_07065 [Dongiaceae bacterium]|nr:hypothetical protein [Dongiaceae bacterium]
MLGDVLSFLRTQYKPGPGQFLQIDPKILIDRMDLRGRAQERGRVNQPDTASAAMDEVEREIEGTIRTIASEDQARTYDQIATYEQRLRSADVAGAAVDMRVLARQAESDMESMLLAVKGDLRVARKEVIERERALEAFKRDNRLKRPAHPPRGHFLFVAILVLLFAAETLPNAVILGEGEELGIAGGYTVAILFSLLNLGLGFSSGRWGWTNAIHRSPLRALLGLVFAAACLGGVVLINFALAHYRAAVESGMPAAQAAAAVIPMMREDPWALGDIKSAIMVMLGVFSALVVMLEGWLWDEPYPGYGEVSQHLRDAQAHYHDLVEEKLDHLKGVQEEFVGRIQVERSRLRDRRQEIPFIMQERQRLIARFKTHLGHLQDVGRQALSVYRDANRKARTTQAPKRFDEVWELNGFGAIEIAELPQIPEAEYAKANKALEDSINKLQTAYEEAIRWIRHLSEHDPELEQMVPPKAFERPDGQAAAV